MENEINYIKIYIQLLSILIYYIFVFKKSFLFSIYLKLFKNIKSLSKENWHYYSLKLIKVISLLILSIQSILYFKEK